MPTVRLVPEDSTDPIVADVFADIKATKKIDFVPNIWRALATRPQHLALCWAPLKVSVRRFCLARCGPLHLCAVCIPANPLRTHRPRSRTARLLPPLAVPSQDMLHLPRRQPQFLRDFGAGEPLPLAFEDLWE